MKKTICELFAGVGGFRLGFDRLKSGWETVWFSQFEPGSKTQHAYNCYVEHFGNSTDKNGDITTGKDISTVDKTAIPDHSLLTAGFPCFPAGTLVLRKDGFVPIEDIKVGDYVLTHKGRFRKVLKTGSQLANTIILRGQGTTGIECTPNHPFLTRTKKRVYNRKSELYGKSVLQNDEKWTNAEDCAGKFWANIYDIEKLPIPKIDAIRNVDTDSLFNNLEFWYFVGRWVGDGCLSYIEKRNDKRILLSCAFKEFDELNKHLEKSGLHFQFRKDKTEYNFCKSSAGLYDWLEENFGKGAINKTIPAWLFGADESIRKSFLRGYLDADGALIAEKIVDNHRFIEHYQATTISHKLSIGLKILFEQFGFSVSMGKNKPNRTRIIDGRVVNENMTYTVRALKSNRTTVDLEGKMWGKIRNFEEGQENVLVYKMMVDEDHSYTVDGIICKNCQDYSVARSKVTAMGIEGKKGVLWWQIYETLLAKNTPFCLFENVDRLVKSPAKQRGRDFGIMLTCLNNLGYTVEWRIVNAASYGAAQRRKRTYIFAYKDTTKYNKKLSKKSLPDIVEKEGFFANVFKISEVVNSGTTTLYKDITKTSEKFSFNFENAGVMRDGKIYTAKIKEDAIKPILLGSILESSVDEKYYITAEKMKKWVYLKGGKKIPRKAANGHEYMYSEGPVPFPDEWDKPARTLLTSEGVVSRTSHAVKDPKTERLRILTPKETERLQGFDDDWTNTGMTERMRYFCMGNALVVPMVTMMGKEIDKIIGKEK